MSTRIPRDYVKCQPSSSACFKQNELAACCRRLLSQTLSKKENIKLSLYFWMKWAIQDDLVDIWRSLIYLKLWLNLEIWKTGVLFCPNISNISLINIISSKWPKIALSCSLLGRDHVTVLFTFPEEIVSQSSLFHCCYLSPNTTLCHQKCWSYS